MVLIRIATEQGAGGRTQRTYGCAGRTIARHMPSCQRTRCDSLVARRLQEHAGAAGQNRRRHTLRLSGRRASSVLVAATSILRDPVKYTAALRSPARPVELSAEMYRSLPSGGGDGIHGGGSRRCYRRRSRVALLAFSATTAGTCNNAAETATSLGSTATSAAARCGCMTGLAASGSLSFAGRARHLAFAARVGVVQQASNCCRPTTAVTCMSQTSQPVFEPHAGERTDGSPGTSSSSIAGNNEDHHGGAGGSVDVPQPILHHHTG